MIRITSSEPSTLYVDDYHDDDVFNHADCVPPLLAILNSLDKRHAEGVIEHQSSSLEVNTMLRFVAFVLRLVPLEFSSFVVHTVRYIQYRTYTILSQRTDRSLVVAAL